MSSGRIQVKLSGRRFEFARDVALDNMGLFRDFFASGISQEKQNQLLTSVGCVHETAQQKLIGGGSEETLDVFSFNTPASDDGEPSSSSSSSDSSTLPKSTPDYFGLIQVSLRKNKEPALNWEEMNPKEQASVAWIVNTFKIEKLMDKYGKVTAKNNNDENKIKTEDAAVVTNGEMEEVLDKMADALAKAHVKIAEAQDAQLEEARRKQEAERDERRKKRAAEKNQQGSSSSDDENVVLSGVGCFFCGIATHNDDVCKFNPKNMMANDK